MCLLQPNLAGGGVAVNALDPIGWCGCCTNSQPGEGHLKAPRQKCLLVTSNSLFGCLGSVLLAQSPAMVGCPIPLVLNRHTERLVTIRPGPVFKILFGVGLDSGFGFRFCGFILGFAGSLFPGFPSLARAWNWFWLFHWGTS